MEINIGQPRTEDSCVVYETVKVKLKKQTFITHHGSSRKHPVFWGVFFASEYFIIQCVLKIWL